MNSPISPGPKPRLRPETFRLMRDWLNERTGLQFGDDSAYVFERRLEQRLAALQLDGYDDYYKLLRLGEQGDAEFEELVERLTTKETYFYRQDYQLEAFEHELLPRLAQQRGGRKRLTVWSAGCATGEEPYTLAIMLERYGLFTGWDVRVIGSDISKRSIGSARRGIYRQNSFRVAPDWLRPDYFTPCEGGWQVDERIRRMCHFGQLNLLERARASLVGRIDVVFCRNVLIYFDANSRKRVIDNLYERLLPGGYLLLGHSESLLNVSTAFELVHLKGDLVYRRPALSAGTEEGDP
jgi:chemotaxis protein methyltransferase CheR